MATQKPERQLVRLFPLLANTAFKITSPETAIYNCVAWAMNDDSCVWWPDNTGWSYWPRRSPHKITLDAFVQTFKSLRFVECKDGTNEPDFLKIAIFTQPDGVPTHVARQLGSGFWTSKLGDSFDIEHELYALEGSEYGKVRSFMKRVKSES